MPPILLTERLRLRPLRIADAIHIYHLDSNPNVMRYIPGVPIPKNVEDAKQSLLKRMEKSDDRKGYWAIEDLQEGHFIGWIFLGELKETKETEIGYRLLEEHWGKGYATEASFRARDYAFRDLDLSEIVAVTLPENLGSQHVLKKIGLENLRDDYFYDTFCKYFRLSKEKYLQLIAT